MVFCFVHSFWIGCCCRQDTCLATALFWLPAVVMESIHCIFSISLLPQPFSGVWILFCFCTHHLPCIHTVMCMATLPPRSQSSSYWWEQICEQFLETKPAFLTLPLLSMSKTGRRSPLWILIAVYFSSPLQLQAVQILQVHWEPRCCKSCVEGAGPEEHSHWHWR